MKFSHWLEAKSPIVFGSFFKDGTITVYINGVRHVYITDAAYHDNWQRLSQHAPNFVLKQIQDLVKKGYAKQEEPKVDKPKSFDIKPVKLTQKTLF